MKLSGDQRATIVENDPVACDRLRQLNAQVKRGEISIERATRLRYNIEGNAISRWVDRCNREHTPIVIGLKELELAA